MCLQDLGLKTGILEFLSVCVDTQPGLIEVFLNVQTVQPTDPSKVMATSFAQVYITCSFNEEELVVI